MLNKWWKLYVDYCELHLIDAYNMDNLAHFESDTLYEDGNGNLELQSDLEWSEYWGRYVHHHNMDVTIFEEVEV